MYRSLLTSLTCLSTLGWLTGCVTAPEQSAPPVPTAEVWSSESPQPPSAPIGWLDSFPDPQLAALITLALEENPNLQIAAARIEQAAAEAGIQRADRLPTADLGLNGSRRKINTFGPQSTGGVRFENYDLGLNLSWEIDLWGRLRDQSQAAIAELQATEADLQGARLSLAAQVTKAWLQRIAAIEQLQLAENSAQTYGKNLESQEARFQKGLSSGLELRLLRRQAASAEAEVSAYRRQLDQSTKALEILIGRYPKGTLPYERTELPELPASMPVGLPADLLARRPDLIAAERRLAATEQSVDAAKKSRLPRISLTASGGTSSQDFDNLLDGDFSVWSLAGNLTQPIFQAGRIRANIDRSTSLRDQAVAQYVDAALQAFYEVETSLTGELYLREQVAQLASAVEEAQASETLSRDRYSQGTAEFIDYLNAQREAVAIRSQLTTTRRRLLENRIDLYLALGGPITTQP